MKHRDRETRRASAAPLAAGVCPFYLIWRDPEGTLESRRETTMNRLSTALCLSASLAAVAMAALALTRGPSAVPSSDRASVEELREVRSLVASLREEVRRLAAEREQRSIRPRTDAGAPPGDAAADPEPGDEQDALREELSRLTARLARLEDEETIAQLAMDGSGKVRERRLRSALATVMDVEADPAQRLESFRAIRASAERKENPKKWAAVLDEAEIDYRDLAMPILDIARDPGVDVELRVDSLREMERFKHDEVRQPLLDLLAFDDTPEVRTQALKSLMSHADDVGVQEVILQASQADRHESVQQAARERLPWLRKIALQFTPDSAAARLPAEQGGNKGK